MGRSWLKASVVIALGETFTIILTVTLGSQVSGPLYCYPSKSKQEQNSQAESIISQYQWAQCETEG